MKKFILLITLLALIVVPVLAQEDTTTEETTGPQSTVQIFVVICETSAVVNFSGVMQPGFDIYYQIFSGPDGTGTAITDLRRVQVNGDYAISEVINFNSGATVPAGSTGSAFVSIAREGNSSSTVYTETVSDIQDGCAQPQNPTQTSASAGGSISGTATTSSTTNAILNPFGGFLDVPGSGETEPLVVIGARDSLLQERTNNPGLIFAECDQFPERANPGLIYDSDNVVIFWSWFADTEEQVISHIQNANYDVRLQLQPLQYVNVSDVQFREGNYWVFYTVNIGNLTPGTYGVAFNLDWSQQITDGFDDFGPGTENERFSSSCTFDVVQNPTGAPVDYNGMYSIGYNELANR